MIRILLIVAAVLCAGALVACGAGESAEEADPTAELTAGQRQLLVAGPNAACASEASPEQREQFVEQHPELSDVQLAWVCPDLYPRDYLRAEERVEEREALEALERDGSPGEGN